MSKQKYQRPEVYATGKREKLWRGEWREYYLDAEGKECSRHKSKTWSRANFTKAEAQAELDALLREQQQGGPKRDGAMTLTTFWEEIYYPVHASRWAPNSRKQVSYVWRRYIQPTLGGKKLIEIVKADIDLHLVKLAREGHSQNLVVSVRRWVHSALEEAVDNELIPKNPARKVAMPICRPTPGVRSLTPIEVRALWDRTSGWEYIMWRLLVLTGVRIGEALALTRADLLPTGLLIDKSALNGRPSTTKNKKSRLVPLPASLRAELEGSLSEHNHALMFQTTTGKMHRRGSTYMCEMVERARSASKIPDLTFRMCRTTFSTLFEGDIKDTQEILGHHSAAFTLEVYKKPMPERQQTAMEDLDRKLKVVPIKKGVA